MKILLLGDASNCHRTLATGLRRLGHDVTVASDGTAWMRTERDIDTARRLPGKAGGLELWLRMRYGLRSRLTGYDIVAIHDPIFVTLRPHRVKELFNMVKRGNRSLFLTCLATDTPYVEQSLECPQAVRYNEFAHFGHPAPYALEHPEIQQAWLREPLRSHCDYVYNHIDGAVAVLYEYYMSASRKLTPDRLTYGGIPIDTDALQPVELPERPEKIRIFLGRHADRMTIKGTDRLETAARRALERHPGKGELVIVENRPYAEYLELLKSAHVAVDQAYSYTPATNALLPMAYGIPAVSGAEPEFYDFIGEKDNRPIYNSPVDVDGMTAMFEHILTHPDGIRERGRRSREFVVKHNDCTVVARRFLDFWQSILLRHER
ncbi:MAG: glycosyltransferase [Muribaculaceae bacterium]|nr:glycosyltransferase [Muribaculaceae bacterium]